MTPSHARPGATPTSAVSVAAPLRNSTIGRSRECNNAASTSPISTRACAEARLATITASGFSSRALRSRNNATAVALRASQAR